MQCPNNNNNNNNNTGEGSSVTPTSESFPSVGLMQPLMLSHYKTPSVRTREQMPVSFANRTLEYAVPDPREDSDGTPAPGSPVDRIPNGRVAVVWSPEYTRSIVDLAQRMAPDSTERPVRLPVRPARPAAPAIHFRQDTREAVDDSDTEVRSCF